MCRVLLGFENGPVTRNDEKTRFRFLYAKKFPPRFSTARRSLKVLELNEFYTESFWAAATRLTVAAVLSHKTPRAIDALPREVSKAKED